VDIYEHSCAVKIQRLFMKPQPEATAMTLLSYVNKSQDTYCFTRGASITGWTVARTCYIIHNAKHRKMTAFDP